MPAHPGDKAPGHTEAHAGAEYALHGHDRSSRSSETEVQSDLQGTRRGEDGRQWQPTTTTTTTTWRDWRPLTAPRRNARKPTARAPFHALPQPPPLGPGHTYRPPPPTPLRGWTGPTLPLTSRPPEPLPSPPLPQACVWDTWGRKPSSFHTCALTGSLPGTTPQRLRLPSRGRGSPPSSPLLLLSSGPFLRLPSAPCCHGPSHDQGHTCLHARPCH